MLLCVVKANEQRKIQENNLLQSALGVVENGTGTSCLPAASVMSHTKATSKYSCAYSWLIFHRLQNHFFSSGSSCTTVLDREERILLHTDVHPRAKHFRTGQPPIQKMLSIFSCCLSGNPVFRTVNETYVCCSYIHKVSHYPIRFSDCTLQ